jgi:hypothetical protein
LAAVGGQWLPFFVASVLKLHQDGLLDTTVIHGDGTTTAAKKGGDNIGFNGHKKVKGDKVVAFCDRHCIVIAPFGSAPANRNESLPLREALPQLTGIARVVGLDLQDSIVSLDGVYDCRRNRKAIFNRGLIPNINPNATRYLCLRARSREDVDAAANKLREMGAYIDRGPLEGNFAPGYNATSGAAHRVCTGSPPSDREAACNCQQDWPELTGRRVRYAFCDEP